MEVVQQWPMFRYSVGHFPEIEFRIYACQSCNPKDLYDFATILQESGILASADITNCRIWTFQSSNNASSLELPDGFTPFQSGRCKAAELLFALTRISPQPEDAQWSRSAVNAGGKTIQTQSRPGPLDLYEHFIKANLIRLARNIALYDQWIPSNSCAFLYPFDEDGIGLACYRLKTVRLSLEDSGKLLAVFDEDETCVYQRYGFAEVEGIARTNSSTASTFVLSPSGIRVSILDPANPVSGSTVIVLQGETWRDLVLQFLRRRCIFLDVQPASWLKTKILEKDLKSIILEVASFEVDTEVVFEWPSALLFSFETLQGGNQNDGRSGLFPDQFDCQFDLLDFVLSEIEIPFVPLTASNAMTSKAEDSILDDEIREIDVSDYLPEFALVRQLPNSYRNQNSYPTPVESMQAQVTLDAMRLESEKMIGTPFGSVFEAFNEPHLDRPHSQTSEIADNSPDTMDIDTIGLKGADEPAESYLVSRKLSNGDVLPLAAPTSSEVASGSEHILQVPKISTNDQDLFSPGFVNTPQSRSPESILQMIRKPDHSDTPASNSVSSTNRSTRSVQRRLSISSRQNLILDLRGKPLLQRLELGSLKDGSNRKYSLSGRFPASPMKRKFSLFSPTSVSQPAVTLGSIDDDSSSTGSSNATDMDELNDEESEDNTALLDDKRPTFVGLSTSHSSKIDNTMILSVSSFILQELCMRRFDCEKKLGPPMPATRIVGLLRQLTMTSADRIDLAQIVTLQTAIKTSSKHCEVPIPGHNTSELVRNSSFEAPSHLHKDMVGNQDIETRFVDAPLIKVHRSGQSWEIASSALSFWDALGLEPAYGRKNVFAVCICIDRELEASCRRFLFAMGEAWNVLNFGTHDTFEHDNNGVVIPFSTDSFTSDDRLDAMRDCCEQLRHFISDNSASPMTLVVYIVTRRTIPADFTLLCSCLQASHFSEGLSDAIRWISIIPQEIELDDLVDPVHAIAFSHRRASEVAHEVYDRIPSRISRTKSLKLPLRSEPSITLAQRIKTETSFKLVDQPPASLLFEDSPIHLAYCIDSEHEWLTAAWTDSTGTCQHVASYRVTSSNSLEDIITEIWHTTCVIIGQIRVHWRLYVAKDALFQPKEESTWLSLAKRHNRQPPLTMYLVALTRASTIPSLASSSNLQSADTPAATPQQPATPSVSSPILPQTPASTGMSFAFADSSVLEGEDDDGQLIDKAEESWYVVLTNVRNRSPAQIRYRPALASGSLIKRTGPNAEDPLATMDVDLVAVIRARDPVLAIMPAQAQVRPKAPLRQQSQPQPQSETQTPIQGQPQTAMQAMKMQASALKKNKEEADEILRQILVMYRDLGTLARLRKQEGVASVRPWHVAAARKGVEGVSKGFRNIRFE